MYYHVIISTYSDVVYDEKKPNLSEEKLQNQFLEPYENGIPIFVNGKTIKLNDIDRIKIIRTPSKQSDLPDMDVIESYLHSIEGEDITEDLIKVGYGYRKKRYDEKIIEPKPQSNQIFVVHGHDEEMKQAVARTLEKLGLNPIILHEQPNQGRTIIEKFTDYADGVSFAVVLLSPDDKGYRKDQSSEGAKFRARQNVILELGFFIGKLGRNNVAALFKNDPDFERPSDYDGVLYTPFDDAGNWRFDLVRELKSSGYNVDANRLLS